VTRGEPGVAATGHLQAARPAGSADPETGSAGLTAYVDLATEFAVLAFASWTLIYDVGLALRLTTSALLLVWAACLAAATAGLVRYRRGAGVLTAPSAASRPAGSPAGTLGKSYLTVAAVICGLAAGAAAAWHTSGVPWRWTWIFGALSVALTVAALRARGELPVAPVVGQSPRGSLLALLTAAGLAGFSLFIIHPNGDDAYFVSRSVWTAQHGRIPIDDVVFTNQAVRHIAGEPPVGSIEVLNGALARLLGVSAGTFTYYVALPVATFFAVWAAWLLIRRWAPARPALCFATATVYLLWSGVGKHPIGSFHLARMWQGKAVFVSVLVPLLYAYLTHWAEHRSRRSLLLAVAASIGAVGLTSAAVMVVPLMGAAVVAALLLAGRMKRALGVTLVLVYPVAAGLVIKVFDPVHWLYSAARLAPNVWPWVMLAGGMGVLGGVALWTSPHLVRGGAPAWILAGIAAVATVLVLPGVMVRISDVTGVGSTTWRLLWMIPAPVLVGLLAAVPLPPFARSPSVIRWLEPVPAAVVCAVVLVVGLPVWSYRHATVASRPEWKYDPVSLSLARSVLRADHRPGYLLSTPRIMSALPLITSEVHAVNGREYYLRLLPASRQFVADRELLTDLAGGIGPLPRQAAVNAALTRVGVGYACVWATTNPGGLRLLERADFTPAAHFGRLQCLDKR
jgi:hypothetical protein